DIARSNGLHGFLIERSALHVSLLAPISIANSQTTPGTSHGIYIRGSHVAVRGGTVLGVDADAIYQDSDYSSLTKYHNYNVRVDSVASDVLVDLDFTAYSSVSTAHTIRVSNGANLITHQRNAQGLPPST